MKVLKLRDASRECHENIMKAAHITGSGGTSVTSLMQTALRQESAGPVPSRGSPSKTLGLLAWVANSRGSAFVSKLGNSRFLWPCQQKTCRWGFITHFWPSSQWKTATIPMARVYSTAISVTVTRGKRESSCTATSGDRRECGRFRMPADRIV